MGLPKGAHQVVLAEVEVVDVRIEPIGFVHHCFGDFTCNLEVCREGLPQMTPKMFIAFWLKTHGYGDAYRVDVPCRRIEWRYLP
jgi:hypothetical protein